MVFDTSATERPIRVLIADTTRIHTQLLADALRRDRHLDVIGAESHSRDLIDSIVMHKIDVAVISANLDEESERGLEILRELHNTHPGVRAVVLLDSSKREAIVEALRAGARGLFSRHDSLETLSKCVRQVHEGQIWANNQQLLFAVEALADTPSVRAVDANGLSLLSKREVEVVHCLSEGLTNQEIAKRLGLSQHTIKNYLFRVFDKLGVSNRLELVSLTLSRQAQSFNAPLKNRDRTLGPAELFASTQEAAADGDPTAQCTLAQMYWEGSGVPRDPMAAYQWYLISEQCSLGLKAKIRAAQEQVAEALTREQMIEAEKNALLYQKSPVQS